MIQDEYESYWLLELIDRLHLRFQEDLSSHTASDVTAFIFGRNLSMIAQILFKRYPDMSPEDIRLMIKLES
jgi:hypothetical protein